MMVGERPDGWGRTAPSGAALFDASLAAGGLISAILLSAISGGALYRKSVFTGSTGPVSLPLVQISERSDQFAVCSAFDVASGTHDRELAALASGQRWLSASSWFCAQAICRYRHAGGSHNLLRLRTVRM